MIFETEIPQHFFMEIVVQTFWKKNPSFRMCMRGGDRIKKAKRAQNSNIKVHWLHPNNKY